MLDFMKIQKNIKSKLTQPGVIEFVKEILNNNENICRNDLGKILCDELDFYDRRGKLQLSTCLKALRELEGKGHFSLPAPLTKKRNWKTSKVRSEF